MYRMLYNDNFLFDPFDETRIVSSASITTNVNAASYLDFTIAANHPLYNEIEQRSGIVTLYSDKEKLFQGLITAIDMDMDGNKSVTCSSALEWLRDVQLRPYSTDQSECDEYEFKLDKAPDALDAYFQWLIDRYNAQNKDGRYFTINVNQAADLTRRSLVYFASTSPRSVADAIEDDILGTFGGYLVLRYEDDQLILDLYSDIHEMNEQVIDYGENILDISRSESTDDQYTAVYPIGKTPQYTAEQQKYHDEKAIFDEYMKQRDETERAAINQLQKEEEAEQKRITGMPNGQAKNNAENALKKRKDQRQAREKAFSDETKLLQDAQKIKDDKNAADKTKPNPITIESLDNGGYPGDLDIFKEGDVVYSVSYVQRYGYKEFVYSDTNVEDKQLLLALAVAKLKSLLAPSLTVDVRAVDQALYNPKHTHLFAGQAVRVRSKPHGVDEFMMVSAIDLDLIDPSRTTATLGVAYDTLTGQQSSFLRNLNSKIVASVDAVGKLGEDVKVTETTLGRVETVVDKVAADNELIVNTVGDYKWMTDAAWGKAEEAQESADEANRGVTDTNFRIDNIKMETDERIDGMGTDISDIHDSVEDTKARVEQAKQTAEQIRQEAQTGIQRVSDDLTTMGKNLDGLINPSFASNSRYGWTINPTGNIRMSTTDTSVGGPYLVVDSPKPSARLMTFINDGILTFTPGHTYRFHILTKTTNRSILVDDEGLTIRLVKPGTTTWLTPYANISKAAYPTAFATISRDITITKDAASAQLQLAFNAQPSGGSICIKSVAIEDITESGKALVKTSELEREFTGFSQTVSETYATKTQLSDEMNQSLKTVELRGRQDDNYWLKLGRLTMAQNGKDFHIDYTGGRAFNGEPGHNSQLEIHVRSSNGGGNLFAVTVNRLLNADMHRIKAFVIDATHIDLYMSGGGRYSSGTMAYYGQYSDFSGAKQIEDISTAEGTELTVLEQSLSTKTYVEQKAESVSIGVVEDFKDGKHGDRLTTQSNLTALKDEINLTVRENYEDISEKIDLKGSEIVVQNPSFEVADFAGWAKHDNWLYDTTGGHTGQNYAVEPIDPNANGDELINSGSIKVEFGHTYRVSFWAKSDLAKGVYAYLRYQRKSNGVWETTMYGLNGDMIAVGQDWTQITFDIEPEQEASEIRVRIIGRNNTSGVAYFAVDDVSLTDYSVAKTINETMAGINIKADSIVQEVRNDYATKDLVNRSVPGLKNPNFDAQKDGDNTITGWSVFGPWAETKLGNTSPVSKSEGGTYFVGKSGTTAGQTLTLINEGYISAYPGMKVQISWWMFVDSNIIKDSNFSAGIIANGVATRNHLSDYSTGGWKYMTTTVEVPANVNQFRVRFGFVTTGTSGWLRIDSVSVTDVTEAKAALGKATTVETNLENYKITVSDTYVDNDTVKGMQTQWNQTAKGFEASIKASSSSISVVNPGFETGDTTGWTASNFKDISVSDGALFQNTTHRFLGYRDGSDGYKMPILANEGTVTARKNDYIKVSARVLLLDESNNSLGGWMSIGVMNAYSGIVHLGDVDITGGGWNTVSYNVQATEDGLYSLWLVFPIDIDESTKILVDDVTMANETEAIHADSRINALETRIAMTSEGVRVGKIEDGIFKGTSALMNSEGSFDILQGEETVSSFTKSGVKLMRDSTTNKYQFNIIPFKYETGGSVNMAYQGVNLQSIGIFSLNGVPATPAVDLISMKSGGVTNVTSATELPWNTTELFNSQAVKHLDGRVLHDLYYGNINNGVVPCAPDEVDHCICVTSASDSAGIQNTSNASHFMILHPAWYMIQMQANINKPSNVTTIDVRLQILPVGANTWVTPPGTYDFRSIEQGDSQGWHTRPTSTFFCKFDVGTRLRWRIIPNANTTTVGSFTKFTITRLPFSGLDTGVYNY